MEITKQNKLLMQHLSGHKEFVCGWGAAMINISVTFPINKVIFRQVITLCYLTFKKLL